MGWGSVSTITLTFYVPLKHPGAVRYGKTVNIRYLNAILVKTKADGPSCPTRFWGWVSQSKQRSALPLGCFLIGFSRFQLPPAPWPGPGLLINANERGR